MRTVYPSGTPAVSQLLRRSTDSSLPACNAMPRPDFRCPRLLDHRHGGFMTTGSSQFAASRRFAGFKVARWTVGIGLAAAAVGGATALSAQQTAPPGIVVGFVTDGATGQPLSGTSVAINGTPLG